MIPDSYSDPIALFEHFFAQAKAQTQPGDPHDPTAVALATADGGGRPSVRMVLLKGVDSGGFVFFTNYESRKAEQLAENRHAALCFYWAKLGVQVRVEGLVEKVDAGDSDAYFATRPRGSQLAAWASRQSAPLSSRELLLKRYHELEVRHADAAQPVPRPAFWGGYRVAPSRIEYWENEMFRMHDRLLYERENPQGPWSRTRLYP